MNFTHPLLEQHPELKEAFAKALAQEYRRGLAAQKIEDMAKTDLTKCLKASQLIEFLKELPPDTPILGSTLEPKADVIEIIDQDLLQFCNIISFL